MDGRVHDLDTGNLFITRGYKSDADQVALCGAENCNKLGRLLPLPYDGYTRIWTRRG